jgi:hypothetical protein
MSDFAIPAAAPKGVAFYKRPLLRWLGASLVFLALIVALMVVYLILSARLDDSKAALHSLQRQTQANTAAIKATKQTDLSKVTADLSAQSKRISLLASCLPEMQTQLNGLYVDTGWQSGYDGVQFLTSAYLANNTIISRVCQPVLNGK